MYIYQILYTQLNYLTSDKTSPRGKPKLFVGTNRFHVYIFFEKEMTNLYIIDLFD